MLYVGVLSLENKLFSHILIRAMVDDRLHKSMSLDMFGYVGIMVSVARDDFLKCRKSNVLYTLATKNVLYPCNKPQTVNKGHSTPICCNVKCCGPQESEENRMKNHPGHLSTAIVHKISMYFDMNRKLTIAVDPT